jgi:hypothetical protein
LRGAALFANHEIDRDHVIEDLRLAEQKEKNPAGDRRVYAQVNSFARIRKEGAALSASRLATSATHVTLNGQ